MKKRKANKKLKKIPISTTLPESVYSESVEFAEIFSIPFSGYNQVALEKFNDSNKKRLNKNKE